MNKTNPKSLSSKISNGRSFLLWFQELLIGDKENYTLENRIFNAACWLNIFSCLIAFVWHGSLNLPGYFHVIFGTILIIFLTLYYFARFKKVYKSFYFVIFSLLALTAIWFSFEGSKGSTPIIYILAIIGFVSISKKQGHFIYLLLTLLHLAVLYLLELSFYDELIFQYPNAESKRTDIIFTLVTTLLFSFAFISFVKRNYDAENEIIQNQKKELQDLNDTKNKFFSILAHDLKSPYIGMLGLSQLMKEKSVNISPDEFKMFANELEETAQSTYKLLENLLDWGQIQQGLISTQNVTIHLLPFIFESVKEAELFSNKKNIKMKIDVPETISVSTDKNMLQTIFRNILSNAIKFTPRGKEIIITTKVKKDHSILFSIKDNGIGISKMMLENMFKIDVKTKRLGTEGESSTGLGLLLCKEFVEKLGGQIWIDSEEGKGTDIKFTLPIK